MKSKLGIRNRKVAVIGVGFVGSSIAYALALRDIAREIVLIDVDHKRAEGEAKDIRHGLSSMGTPELYAGDYDDCEGCDLIIITAGRGRRPGESRFDLAGDNVAIMKEVIEKIRPHYTGGAVMIVSNPVDILTYKAAQWLGLPNGMVFGTGCILDTSRFMRSIADYLEVSTGVVHGYIVGVHADRQVPVWSHATVSGFPIAAYCKNVGLPWGKETEEAITKATRAMAAEIIRAKGKTQYGIATCVCKLAYAILNQYPTMMSVSSVLEGEYGVEGVALSVPSIIGPAGVQQRIEEHWSASEREGFLDAAASLKELLKGV